MKNELGNLLPPQLIQLSRIVMGAMAIINARLLTLLGMLLSAAAFGVVLWQPDWIRAFAACMFAVLVFWPLARLDAKRLEERNDDHGTLS